MELYASSYRLTDRPICGKLLANGLSYLLMNGAIYAKLLANGLGLYTPSYWLTDWGYMH